MAFSLIIPNMLKQAENLSTANSMHFYKASTAAVKSLFGKTKKTEFFPFNGSTWIYLSWFPSFAPRPAWALVHYYGMALPGGFVVSVADFYGSVAIPITPMATTTQTDPVFKDIKNRCCIL
jgi:hypothetical protein